MTEPRKRLTSPSGKDIVLTAVRPNAGVAALYTKRLTKMVDGMHRAVLRSVRAIYEALPPELAQDESPAMALANEMRRLARKWLGRFEEEGPKQARRFAREAQRSTDASMAARLRDQGFSVQFKVTAEMNDAYQAVVAENVGLIRSIAEQHLQRVQGSVMRSVSTGRDLETLAKDIEKRYRLTRKRAGFIARDQNNKATAVITRVRQEGLGITHARWRHSRAGKQPRKSHLQADGEIYEVARGMFLDGKWIRPGEEPNCRCVSQSIIPGFE